MIVVRMSVLLLATTIACGAPAPSRSTAVPAPGPRPAFDSATAERLCVRPDLVRAGIAECVLKDQSPPPGEIRRPPPSR